MSFKLKIAAPLGGRKRKNKNRKPRAGVVNTVLLLITQDPTGPSDELSSYADLFSVSYTSNDEVKICLFDGMHCATYSADLFEEYTRVIFRNEISDTMRKMSIAVGDEPVDEEWMSATINNTNRMANVMHEFVKVYTRKAFTGLDNSAPTAFINKASFLHERMYML